MTEKEKQLSEYITDLDNLLGSNFFPEDPVQGFTVFNEDLNLKQFIEKGRKLLMDSLVSERLSEK
jgi:hypothetical protein